MKKISKITAAVCLTLILMLGATSNAEARRFWGKETRTQAYDGGWIRETTTHYILWIKVKEISHDRPCC